MEFDSYFDFRYRDNHAGLVRAFGTAAKAFDVVAPILIYHDADIKFRSKAMKAFRTLKKTLPEQHFLVEGVDHVDDIWPGTLLDVYNGLLAEHVEDRFADHGVDAKFVVDSYGGFGYRVKDESLFTGDGRSVFAYYETAALVDERLGIKPEVKQVARMRGPR